MIVLQILNLAALLAAVAWCATKQDLESLTASIALFGSLLALEMRDRKSRAMELQENNRKLAELQEQIRKASDQSTAKVYEEQTDLYADVEKYIDQHGAKHAVLVQYSGTLVKTLLRKLLSKGATVTLYVIDPASESVVSEEQRERIKESLKALEGELRVPALHRLRVYCYDAPASMRAVSVDDKLLAIGWYTYEHKLKPDPNYATDRIEISGHDVAGLLLHHGSQDFVVLNEALKKLVNNYHARSQANSSGPILELPSV